MKRIICTGMLISIIITTLLIGVCAVCSTNANQNSLESQSVTFKYQTEERSSKTILINLDFDGGTTNSSSLTIGKYGESINGLPLDLVKEGYDFIGWFTKPNCDGYQVADANGFVKNRNVLTESIYGVNEESKSISLYAGWKPKKFKVALNFGNDSYLVEVENGNYLEEVNLTNEILALSFSVNPSGNPLFNKPITSDVELYVISYKKVDQGRTYCCEDNNGYNSNKSGSNNDVALHKGWSMGNAELVVKKTSESYTEYSLNYHLLQDIHNLPLGKLTNKKIRDCWLGNDSYSENVHNTGIRNQKIGFGAYSVKVIYRNGSSEEFTGVNFLSSYSKYDDINLCSFSAKESNPIKKIKVSVMYELIYNNDYLFGWIKWGANYRCDYIFQ